MLGQPSKEKLCNLSCMWTGAMLPACRSIYKHTSTTTTTTTIITPTTLPYLKKKYSLLARARRLDFQTPIVINTAAGRWRKRLLHLRCKCSLLDRRLPLRCARIKPPRVDQYARRLAPAAHNGSKSEVVLHANSRDIAVPHEAKNIDRLAGGRRRDKVLRRLQCAGEAAWERREQLPHEARLLGARDVQTLMPAGIGRQVELRLFVVRRRRDAAEALEAPLHGQPQAPLNTAL
ncbi:hypothetical protein IWX47DRAFT_139064 [Phyllosticta citricarpa]